MATHMEVCSAYFAGHGPQKGHNVFIKDNVLWSYGRHFWLARATATGQYLLNGDYYSMSTRKHQSYAQRCAPPDALTVSAGALDLCGIDPETVEVIDATEDERREFNQPIRYELTAAERQEVESEAREWLQQVPDGATIFFHSLIDKETGEKFRVPRFYHRPGSALLKRPAAKGTTWPGGMAETEPEAWFIMGTDESQYFISRLPGPADTVDAAFRLLMPPEVQKATDSGRKVQRQGEWYFINLEMEPSEARAIYQQLGRNYDLTDASGNEGAAHIATRGARASEVTFTRPYPELTAATFIVSGQIRHSTRQHRMLKLSKADRPQIFAAYRNTATESYSMNTGQGPGID